MYLSVQVWKDAKESSHPRNRTELSSLSHRHSFIRFIHMSALFFLPDVYIVWTFYETCSKCIPTYVLTGSLPKLSLPNIFVSFLYVDKNVKIFHIVLVIYIWFLFSYRLVFIGEKTRRYFNMIFKKSAIMKYMAGKLVFYSTESHKMQNNANAFWNVLNNLGLWLTIIFVIE